MHKKLSSLLLTFLLLWGSVAEASFTYYSPWVVDHTKVPSTQTNFPVLILMPATTARFKTTGNSGHVGNSSGFDIRPYSNSNCSTGALTYEIVDGSYSATTGAFQMYVLISSLSSSSDTTIYLCYGDSGLSTDGGSTSTWSTPGYIWVGHAETLHTASLVDSWRCLTASCLNQDLGTSNVSITTGKVGNGASFSGNGYIRQTNTPFTGFGTRDFSWQAWIKTSTADMYIMGQRNGCTNSNLFEMYTVTTHIIRALWQESSGTNLQVVSGTSTVDDNNWHRIVATRSGTTGKVYVDGTNEGTNTIGATTNVTGGGGDVFGIGRIGSDPPFQCGYYTGVGDEVYYLDGTALSADWATTDYNNQNSPSTFGTLGTEVMLGSTPTGSRGFIIASLDFRSIRTQLYAFISQLFSI